MSLPTCSTHQAIAKIKSLLCSNNPTQCFALCSQLLSSSQDLHPLHTSTLHFYTALLHEDIARSSSLPTTILHACEKALKHYHLAISAVECLTPTEHRVQEKEKEKEAQRSDTYNLDDILSPAPCAAPPGKQEENRDRVDSPFDDMFEDRTEEGPRPYTTRDLPGEKMQILQPVAFQRPSPKSLAGVQSPRVSHLTYGISTWVLTLHRLASGVRDVETKAKNSFPMPKVKKVRFAVDGWEDGCEREDAWEMKERKNAWKRKGGYGCRDVGRWRRERFDAGGVRRFCEEVIGEIDA